MKIYLRKITKDDSAMIVKWRNSHNVLAHCFIKNKITIESQEEFFTNFVETGKYAQFIVERMDEDFGAFSYPIATVYLKDMDTFNKRCELCIFTSEDQEWNTESQAIAVKMLLYKAFKEYGMHKIYSYIFYKFLSEAELLKNAGFYTEAILRNEAIDEYGEYVDVVRFAITN